MGTSLLKTHEIEYIRPKSAHFMRTSETGEIVISKGWAAGVVTREPIDGDVVLLKNRPIESYEAVPDYLFPPNWRDTAEASDDRIWIYWSVKK